MSYRISPDQMNEIFVELQKDYRIYAPKRFPKRGRYSDTDLVRYAEINSAAEIVYEAKSDFSPKEVLYPITQTLFYFTEDEYRESRVDERGLIIFARPCDINGIRRLDTIFLKNGQVADSYYKRVRDKVKFALMECRQGWDTCFCVSMEANRTDNYSLAVRFGTEHLLVDVKDDQLKGFFAAETEQEFTPEFVQSNQRTVSLPEIDSSDLLKKVYELDLWKSFNSRCLSCGACTVACITCSCFNTSDIIYNENSRAGERRRIWASCLHEEFTDMAGGHRFRNTAGDRMRFKTLHKVYDYKARFGEEQMCVGCGRCDDRCPESISFSATINRLHDEVGRLKKEAETTGRVMK